MRKPILIVIAVAIFFVFVAPSFAASSNSSSPDPDKLLEEVSQGKARPVSLEEAAAKANEIAIRLIKVIQKVALPVTMVIFLIGAIIMGIGWGTGNTNLRRVGGGAALGAIGVYVLVRLAPIIFGTVVGIVK